jgi:hypothetical protein
MVCSRYIVPSGFVPGGDVVDHAAMLREGGEGAGLDGYFQNFIRVLGAKCKDRIVISIFVLILDVKCNSTAEKE